MRTIFNAILIAIGTVVMFVLWCGMALMGEDLFEKFDEPNYKHNPKTGV